MDESRTDEVDIADVVSSVRLIYKALLKKEEKEKKSGSHLRKKWLLIYINSVIFIREIVNLLKFIW